MSVLMSSPSSDLKQTAAAPFSALRWLTPVGSFSLLLGTACTLALVAQSISGTESISVWGIALVVLLTAIITTLDGLLVRRHGEILPRRMAWSVIIVYSVLVEGVILVNGLTYGSIMYLILPLPVFFLVGRSAGIIMSMGLLIWFTSKFSLLKPDWLAVPELLNGYILFVISLTLIVAMAQVVHRERANRQHAEALLSDLEASHIRLARYAEQIAELATTEERNRLARDIHDSLGHYLTVIGVQLEKAVLVHEDNPAVALDAVRSAKRVTDQALADVRQSVGALRERPSFRLRPKLERLIANLTDLPFAIQLMITGSEIPYQPPQLEALYRAAQEGLTNVQKHARASHVVIEIILGENTAMLRLTDDGVGISTNTPFGFGLQGIRERVHTLGGEMALKPASHKGTQLMVSIPNRSIRRHE